MGAGKSTIRRHIADQLHSSFMTQITKMSAALVPILRGCSILRAKGFRRREETVITDLTELQGIVLATGGSVVSKEVRNKLSARGIVVYLETPIEKQVVRTQRDKRRPLLQTKEDPQDVLERLAEERNPLYQEVADFTVRTDEQSAKVVANQIIEKLDF